MSDPTAVRLDNVRFSYTAPSKQSSVSSQRESQLDVIDIPQLEVKRGEHLFIEGPSGCGKSTLLGLLGGISVPNSGTVEVLDQDLTELSARQRDSFRADHIGYIFQMFNLLPYLSLTDNVTLPCKFSQRRRQRLADADGSPQNRAEQLLKSLGLEQIMQQNRPVSELSIGQQQRVAAARALIGAPEFIIADEPTSALDRASSKDFIELLFSECEQHGSTLILVSHDTELGLHFDRRIALPSINNAASGNQATC